MMLCRFFSLLCRRLSPFVLIAAGALSLVTLICSGTDNAFDVIFVDCANGDDSNPGNLPNAPLATIQHAIDVLSSATATRRRDELRSTIHITGGICTVSKAIDIAAKVGLHLAGDGSAAISGGALLKEWKAVGGGKYAADVPSNFPIDEIKGLRIGSATLSRGRWPKRAGEGLETPNFLFAQAWSSGTADPSGHRSMHKLGIDLASLPKPAAESFSVPFANNTAWFSAYAHVLGCIEKDVNSQLTRVLGIHDDASTPSVDIFFRNSFTANQRFYFENVDWGVLAPGEFFHDIANGKVYAMPASGAQEKELLLTGAVAPVLDTLLHVHRSVDIAIENLAFMDTTFFADGFWDGPAQQPSDAAVRINYSQNITVVSCSFLESLGGNGVAVGNATVDSSITKSLFDSLGEGGVVMYGYDASPVPATGGTWAGNNTQPRRIEVSYNVMSDLGNNLVHVAGVALRAASYCHIHHNRISHTTRYGLQADSFYPNNGRPSLQSRYNLLEFNILNDTCRTTTDTGAIEMLGSGDPFFDGAQGGWDTATVVRFNNITNTVGSSSSDGKHVCVHGSPAGPWCRRLVWGIYLDGGQSGVTVFGNIIGASLHGAIFDNAGGNNTHENNIFLGEAGPDVASALMDFGAPGTSKSHPVNSTISGSIVKRNIFYSRDIGTKVLAAQVSPFLPELKPNGSDFNLFFNPFHDLQTLPVFPGEVNLSSWQGRTGPDASPVMCSNTPGSPGKLLVSSDCSYKWKHNATDKKFRLLNVGAGSKYALNIDCDGDYAHCKAGDSSTRICLDRLESPWNPNPPAPIVDNQGWIIKNISGSSSAATNIISVASGKCMEVCYRGGDVGGCNGHSGSLLQLNDCIAGAFNQQFEYSPEEGGMIKFTAATANGEKKQLCVAVPPRGSSTAMDKNSIVADPLFTDPNNGDFSLGADSPAIARLGFKPIPPIHAPSAACGRDAPPGSPSCLEAFFRDGNPRIVS